MADLIICGNIAPLISENILFVHRSGSTQSLLSGRVLYSSVRDSVAEVYFT